MSAAAAYHFRKNNHGINCGIMFLGHSNIKSSNCLETFDFFHLHKTDNIQHSHCLFLAKNVCILHLNENHHRIIERSDSLAVSKTFECSSYERRACKCDNPKKIKIHPTATAHFNSAMVMYMQKIGCLFCYWCRLKSEVTNKSKLQLAE